MICKWCGSFIPDDQTICPGCGRRQQTQNGAGSPAAIPQPPKKQKNGLAAVALILALIAVAVSVLTMLRTNKAIRQLDQEETHAEVQYTPTAENGAPADAPAKSAVETGAQTEAEPEGSGAPATEETSAEAPSANP